MRVRMCGCWRCAAMRISRRNRSAPSAPATSGWSTLMATGRSCLTSCARNTVAMPPLRPPGSIGQRSSLPSPDRTALPDLRPLLQDGLAGIYAVEREVGRGGMATVFLAHDVKHDRPVAIKVLHPEVAGALGADRFLREIRIAAHLQHPHILTLIDSGEIPRPDHMGPSLLYYVMPYVEGESLRERLTREGRLTPTDTARTLQEVLDALTHAHGLGIVHRDIKPENIMLSGRHALVMDFGVAKAASAAAASASAASGTLTALGLAIGTPNYMAPEQAAGMAAVDARTDLYAVGVMAYEMLTGQTPFTGTTPQAILAAHVTQMPPPIAARRPDLAASGTLTALGLAIGTPNYMAPEQAAGMAAVDARTDLYAVGVMAYEMLTGQTPFTGTTPQAILAAHVTQMPPPIAARRPDLAAPFASAVMRCLEKEPAARWQSAEALRAHIEAFATPGSGVTALAGGGGAGVVRRRPAALLTAALVAVVILGAATWFGPGRRARERHWGRGRS